MTEEKSYNLLNPINNVCLACNDPTNEEVCNEEISKINEFTRIKYIQSCIPLRQL